MGRSRRFDVRVCISLPQEHVEFLRDIRIGGRSKAAHNNPPLYRFSGIRLLDPFAGFCSIPLETMRLGLKATAVEIAFSTFKRHYGEYCMAKHGKHRERTRD